MWTFPALKILTPVRPARPRVLGPPLMSRPLSLTLSVTAALTMIPFVEVASAPASVLLQSITSDFVIVTAPNPPGSKQLISPPAAVFEIAPANVLHGAVREHGLTSSPTPETQVRVAWPNADEGTTNSASAIKRPSQRSLRAG